MLPELASEAQPAALSGEYSSSVITADAAALKQLIKPYMGTTTGSAELYA